MARYESGERKKLSNTLKAKYPQVIPVLPLSGIGSPTGKYTYQDVMYSQISAGDELQPIGSVLNELPTFSNQDFITIDTSTTYITSANYPRISSFLPPRQTSVDAVYLGNSSCNNMSGFVPISSLNKIISITGGSATIGIYDNSNFPNTFVAKTSPFAFSATSLSFKNPCSGAYGVGKLCILNRYTGTSGALGLISSDLNTFTQFTFPVSGLYQNLIHNGTNFIATTYASNVSYIYTSADAQTFTQRKNLGNLGEVLLTSNDSGVICAVPTTGTNVFISTDNGLNFTNYPLPISATWVGLCWSSLLQNFYLVSSDGKIAYSTNGNTWIYYSLGLINYSTITGIISTDQGLVINFIISSPAIVNLFSRNGFNWVSLFDSKATNSSMTPFSLINLGSSFLFHYIYYNGSNYMANTRKVSLSSTELEIMPITAPTNGTTTKWFIRGR